MTHADDVLLTFHAYAPVRKYEMFRSADNPLYRVFVTPTGLEMVFLGFGAWLAADVPNPAAMLIGGAFNALTSTGAGELARRDREVLSAGPTACRTSHANNFVIRRDDIADVTAWSPSFLRRWLLSDDHLGRARIRLTNGKSHTLRFRDPESWRVASAELAAALGQGARAEATKS